MKKHIIYILFIGTPLLILGCYTEHDPVEPYEYEHIVNVPTSYRSFVYERPYYYRPYHLRYRTRHHHYRTHRRHYRTHRRHYRPSRRIYVKKHQKRIRPRVRVQPRRRTYTRPKLKLKKRTVRRYYNSKGKLRKRVIRRRYR